MEFYTQKQSQCRICDYDWFKLIKRPSKVNLKRNSTLNCELNLESVTTASLNPVKGRKKSIQNEIRPCRCFATASRIFYYSLTSLI